MSSTRYAVTNVIIETPRYGGASPMVSEGEHDIIGHGWVEIEGAAITVAVHARGVVGMVGPKERRTYPLAEITSWRATGASITFGVSKLGLFATNGAEAPVHICEMHCADAEAAQQLTTVARAAGLTTGGGQPFHSGI
jgi:hypothetical protein